ncbi:hypothetical protein M422DRAFT_239636 [Sphaerobolus stellatus SS14]|nr:hypothetical protein M422DRAFT_239636 [Sphaerobolus stellatus SS14]
MAIFSAIILITLIRLAEFIANNGVAEIPNPPAPLARRKDGLKLVNDAAHPFIVAGPNDIRGSCSALNTLVSHGYLPRNGTVRPDQTVTATMKGLTWAMTLQSSHQLDEFWNKVFSHWSRPSKQPASVGGLNQRGTFEGDTSMTRVDAYFGDQSAFDETLFQGFIATSKKYGRNGTYDINATAELRRQRLQDTIKTHPQLVFTSPRSLSAYSEALNLDAARGFFQNQRMPVDFHCQPAPVSFDLIEPLVDQIFAKCPFTPGVNTERKTMWRSHKPPPSWIYRDIALRVMPAQYPNLTGDFKKALKKNLDFFFGSSAAHFDTLEVWDGMYTPELQRSRMPLLPTSNIACISLDFTMKDVGATFPPQFMHGFLVKSCPMLQKLEIRVSSKSLNFLKPVLSGTWPQPSHLTLFERNAMTLEEDRPIQFKLQQFLWRHTGLRHLCLLMSSAFLTFTFLFSPSLQLLSFAIHFELYSQDDHMLLPNAAAPSTIRHLICPYTRDMNKRQIIG